MGSARRFFGGLLTGTGMGILEKAKADRRETLTRLRQEGADRRTDKALEGSKGLLQSVVPGEGGNLIGITRGGETKDLGIKSVSKAKTGLSADDRALYDRAVRRHTTGKGSLEGEKTEWDQVAKRLRKAGRSDLASMAASMEGAESGVDVESPEYREAQSQAEEWASSQAKWTNLDKTDFAEWGGSRSQAIWEKTQEFYRSLKGGGQPASQGAAGGTEKYSSKEDVRAAFRAGTLTREQAGKILRESFGHE